MAIMVATSMRDGFSRYLLQGEINRFDDLVQALTDLHAADPAGWEQFKKIPGAGRTLSVITSGPSPRSVGCKMILQKDGNRGPGAGAIRSRYQSGCTCSM
jgi:hypothetical protein